MVISDVFLRRLVPGLVPFVRARQDYSIIDINRPFNEILESLEQLQPAGVMTEALPQKTDRLLSLGFPTVIADTDEIYPGAISLDVDDWQIGREAMAHFVASGFHHFAFLGNLTPYSSQREEGYVESLKGQGFHCSTYIEPERATGRYMEFHHNRADKLCRWLAELPKPVALFAAHDPLGRLASECCLEARLAVPEDVAILGVNNDELVCNLSYPPLSSVGVPWARMGKMLAELMGELLLDKKNAGRALRVAPEAITVRESSSLSAVDDPQLRRALEYMRQHYQDAINLKSVCAELRMNRRTLELKCQRYLGRSPRAELVRLKVEKAKTLLVQTNRSMDWIAQQSGFTDAERLSVVFCASAGMAPSVYRKMYR